MRTHEDKKCTVVRHEFIYRTKITCDVDAPISVIFARKRMIIQQPMKRLPNKKFDSFIALFLFIGWNLAISFLEPVVKGNFHGWREFSYFFRYASASFAV